jgi:hypothetical protein
VRPALLIALSLAATAAAKDRQTTPAPVPRSSQVTGPNDPNKEFHLEQLAPLSHKTPFASKTANIDGFYIQQKFQPKGYGTRDFAAKSWSGNFQFSTKPASTKGYETKDAPTKSAPVKDAHDAGKTAETRALPDGERPYLGREATKMKKPLDPNNLPKITNELHELKTVEDIKELLNKNK